MNKLMIIIIMFPELFNVYDEITENENISEYQNVELFPSEILC